MTTVAKVGIGLGALGLLSIVSSFDSSTPMVPSQNSVPVSTQGNTIIPTKVQEIREIPTAPKAAEKTRSCHPSYSGCLNPDASDYDCAGGSGNGPHYTGPVRVIGPDVFGLDRDRDGWGCE